MIVRCGRCQTSFEVSGPGRVTCPACGTVNEVRGAGPAPDPGGFVAPPPPPEAAAPSPRVTCDDCGFRFIVGDVAEAPCPNCGASVTVPGTAEGAE